MPTICNNGIAIPTTDNTELPCDSYISDGCVVHTDAISYLSLPAGSTQQEINNNLLLSLMDARTRVQILEGQEGFQNQSLDIDGTYDLQSTDDKKFISVNSAINFPRISLDSSLPDGFECYFINLSDPDVSETIQIIPEYSTPPLFTVPIESMQPETTFKNYGIIHVVKRNSNLYTVNGDLYYQAS